MYTRDVRIDVKWENIDSSLLFKEKSLLQELLIRVCHVDWTTWYEVPEDHVFACKV